MIGFAIFLVVIAVAFVVYQQMKVSTTYKQALQPFVETYIQSQTNSQLADTLLTVNTIIDGKSGVEFDTIRRLLSEASKRLKNSDSESSLYSTRQLPSSIDSKF